MGKITVIRDTRERKGNGYYWEENDWCDGHINQKLDVGDYSLVGYEDVLMIERKATSAELAINCNEARFDRELEKFDQFKYAFIICEFSLDDIVNFPLNSGIPEKRWSQLKVTSKFLMRKIAEYQVKYNIKILLCGNKVNAWNMVNSIFKRVIECKK